MKYYIGLDAHSSTSTFAVVDENGQCVLRETVKTSEQSLVHVINRINGERHMTFEESTISQWLYLQLKDKVDNLLICNPTYVAKKQGAKTDFRDALQLKKQAGSLGKRLEQIVKSGNRAANLTRQLLAFSRKQVIQPKVLKINELVRDMEPMIIRLIEENIKIDFHLDQHCKNIKVDPGHFEQILLNLVVNSRDAMPMGGRLTIKTDNGIIDEATALRTNSKAGAYVRLQIVDTGCGMSEEIQKHIFDPFFTTKGVGKGTGLGLSTVYGIVKQNNGLIFFDSKVNVGTNFKVFLPQTDENVPTTNLNLPMNRDLKGKETVLVAEDEVELREIICEALRGSGYSVVEASDGQQALELIQSYSGPIHLILTDAIMPNLSGAELFRRAKDLNFQAKVLFLSGYAEDVLVQHGINSGQTYFLEKPFTILGLLTKVRDLLEDD